MEQVFEKKPKVIPRKIFSGELANDKKLKVAAYARVSTDKDEQEDSFERQVDYYTRYINERSEWEFAGIYADPGITGTQAKLRPDFLRMIQDCKEGKINKILVKSLARFARNTEEALKYIRILKELNIGVYFETMNQDTSEPGGEIMITIMAAMAEEESRTISKNVTWSMDKKFENGDMMLNYTRFLGYTKNENGQLVIVEDEANIVKRIYREYVAGKSISTIIKGLESDKIPAPCGGSKWYSSVILSMLKNEKYCGIALMKKTFKRDVLCKREKNKGQKEMFIMENHHPAIISKETYDLVQCMLNERKQLSGYSDKNKGKYTSKYAFSKKIICGECGEYYRRHAHIMDGVYQATWVCATHKLNSSKCHQLYIKEIDVKKAFVLIMNEVLENYEEVKSILLENLNEIINDDDIKKLEKILEDITKQQNKMMELYKKKVKCEITQDEYDKRAVVIQTQIDILNEKRAKLEENKSTKMLAKNRIEEIGKLVNDNIDEFDDELFTKLIDQIIVRNRYDLEFQFKCGITKTIRASEE